MSVVTKAVFAEMCGLKTNKLWNYTDRGQVILLGDGKIDCDDPRNKAFLEKKSAKKQKQEPQEKQKPQESNQDQETGTDYAALDRQKLSAQVEKLNQEVRLLKIKEEKLKGIVVPSEVIMPVFLQHNQSVLTSVKNESDEFVRLFSKKRGLSGEEIAEIKSGLIEWFNRAMDSASALSKVTIKDIVNNYSITKGVGERE